MWLTLRQFAALTRNTFHEIIRQPIILLLTLTSLVLVSLLPQVALFMFGEEQRLVQDGAFAFQLVLGLLLAGTAASLALYREISRGTAAAVLCKPVSRTVFFLSKYCGVLLVVGLFTLLSLLATLLSARLPLSGLDTDGRVAALLYASFPSAFLLAALVNYFWKRPFVSQSFLFLTLCLGAAFWAGGCLDPAGGFCRFGVLLEWRLAPAGVLIGLALAVFAAIALSLSTRWPPLFSLAGCGVLLFLGLLADYLLGRAAERSWLAAAAYGLLPNWQDFWLVDALAGGGVIPWSYVGGAGLYAGLLTGAILCFGLIAFRNVEIR
jgi:ABC-type transport system involved in multi-copper enzyme maturation permease subunit